MARLFPTLALALPLALLGTPGGARAGATVDLLFVGINGGPIAPTNDLTLGASIGDVLTMAIVWQVKPGAFLGLDGADIFTGLFNAGIDFFADGALNDIGASVRFNAATLGSPEPAAGALFGLGVLGLALLRRRGRGVAGTRRKT